MRTELIPNFSCFIAGVTDEPENELDRAIEEGYKFIYIQTTEGLYKHQELLPGKGGSRRFVRTQVKSVPNVKLAKIEPHAQFLPAGKVPIELLDSVKTFFRELMVKKATAVEAMIWVLWSEEKGYYLFVPNQTVSRASATYEWTGLPSDSIIVVDIHSHADFGAFFSSTDDKDDANSIRFSVVIGNNDKPTPSIKARFNCLDARVDVEIDTIFHRVAAQAEVPDEWINKVKTYSYQSPSHLQGATTPFGFQGSYAPQRTEVRRVMAENDSVRGNGENSKSVNAVNTAGTVIGLDGKPRTPTGPSYAGSKIVKAGSQTELPTEDKKKHFGQQQIASVTEQSTNKAGVGMYEGVITNPKIKHLHGRTWLDTGSGLVDITDQDIADSARVINSTPITKTKAFEQALEEMTGGTTEIDVDKPTDSPAEIAARRAAWETHLSDPQLDAWMAREERKIAQDAVGIDDDLEKFGITAADLPPNYDLLVCNHGSEVANAYAIVTHMSTSLVESDSVLDLCLEEFFSLKDDDGKLEILRVLYQLLPDTAKLKLAHSGF
jgi:PRTRC genetic system protein A